MLIFVDTETSGLPLDGMPDDHPLQPSIVQLAALLCEEGGRERGRVSVIVAPEGRYSQMDAKAQAAHGISRDDAEAYGVPLGVVLPMFFNLAAKADTVVAHNIDFDDRIVAIALAKLGRRPTLPYHENRVCTMRAATPVMQLPPTAKMQAAGFEKHKPPNLGELYRYLFQEEMVGIHDAMADVLACARCFFELRKRGHVG